MEATWTKMKDDSWAARVVTLKKPSVGDPLTMKTKAGATKQVVIDKVLWSKSGVHLCKVSESGASATQAPKRKSRGTWTGCSCGSVEEYAKSSDCSTCRYDRD